MDYWTPLIEQSSLKTRNCLLFDLEGHGLSPTTALSQLSIASFAADLKVLCSQAGMTTGVTLVAHSLGCLVALKCAQVNPGLVSKLVLFGPPPNPLPKPRSQELHARAALVRSESISAVVDTVALEETSQTTRANNFLALSAVRLSLLGQPGEGYAKACTALAKTTDGLEISQVEAKALIVTGAEDAISSPQVCDGYRPLLPNLVNVEVLNNVGHWHVFENSAGASKAVSTFLGTEYV